MESKVVEVTEAGDLEKQLRATIDELLALNAYKNTRISELKQEIARLEYMVEQLESKVANAAVAKAVSRY